MADTCTTGSCEYGPARFFVVRSVDGATGNGIVSADASQCATMSRVGEYRFGCPGDPLSSEDVTGTPGLVGVAGALPVSVQFATPQSVNVGGGGPVQVQVSDAPLAIAASSSLQPSWSVAQSLPLVAVSLSGVAAAALVVVLAVRFTRRIRSAP